MDVLIRNMELPKDGILRLSIFPNGRVEEINSYNEACMSTDAQAVALPEHGAVIDLENLPVHTHYFDVVVKKQDILKNIIYRCDGGQCGHTD